MKIVKYFFEFLFILVLFFIFRILGYKLSSNLGAFIGSLFGPLFRSKKKILTNIKKALPKVDEKNIELIAKKMWKNYGRILSEYVFIKNFRNPIYNKFLTVEGQEILNQLKQSRESVVFISGHFNNFELMAMQIEKSGINLAAIYRPLNNIFLNKIMERIRKKYICKKQIKKGLGGTRELLRLFKPRQPRHRGSAVRPAPGRSGTPRSVRWATRRPGRPIGRSRSGRCPVRPTAVR